MKQAQKNRSVLAAGVWPLAIVLAILLCSCLERVDRDIPVSASGQAETWEYRGSFGGTAEPVAATNDPWEIRFEPGKFREIAGVCATGSEVWVCDLAISRIQVFDFNGKLKREIGSGVSIRDTMLSDKEFYIEDRDFPRVNTMGAKRWEQTAGRRWVFDQQSLFKAADVLVMEDGYIMADQARSSAGNSSGRRARVVMFRNDGSSYTVGTGRQYWPAFLASDGKIVAMAEQPGNALWLGEITDEEWPFRCVTSETNFMNYLTVLVEHADDENFNLHKKLVTRSGSGSNEYKGLGGVAVAFNKLITCDPGNNRLQVLEARRDNAGRWGSVVRVVTNKTDLDFVRFDSPMDIDVDKSGKMVVLDAGRLEVAVLADNFERIGGFGRGEILAPWAIDLSDDGNHCFVTDQRSNSVHHYERSR